MNSIALTVMGVVTTRPTYRVGPSGHRSTRFVLTSTQRYLESPVGPSTEGPSERFMVRVVGLGAKAVAESLAQGQPVVVHGHLSTGTFTEGTADDVLTMYLDAIAVGSDLMRTHPAPKVDASPIG